MKIFGARCLVKEIKNEDNKTQSGIILPGSEKEPTYRGIIIEIGDGAMLDTGVKVPMQVKVGDEVIYQTFSGSPIDVDGDQYIVLNERDILAVIND